jgi:hypothetical protein
MARFVEVDIGAIAVAPMLPQWVCSGGEAERLDASGPGVWGLAEGFPFFKQDFGQNLRERFCSALGKWRLRTELRYLGGECDSARYTALKAAESIVGPLPFDPVLPAAAIHSLKFPTPPGVSYGR